MRIPIIIAALLLMSSCVTQRRCIQKFPPSNDTVRIVERRDSIVMRDTTITIHLPGKVVIDSVFVPVKIPVSYKPDTVRAVTQLAVATAYLSKSGHLRLDLLQSDTTIYLRLENALKEAYFWRNEYEKITVTPQPVKFVPKIYKIALWVLIGQVVSIILYFVIKLKI